MQIAPNLYLAEGVRGANVYLIVEDTLTLVDTGLPGNTPAIGRYISRLGRRPDELKRVVLTHSHLDHSGSAAQLSALTGAKVLAHAAETEGGLLIPGLSGTGGLVFRRIAGLMRVRPVPIDELLHEGDVIPVLGGLKVLHVPGHTPGSICLFSESRGVLFTGDIMLNSGGRLSQPLLMFQHDRELAEKSLEKLLPLDIQLCCFGHSPPLGDGAQAMVTQFVDHPVQTPFWWRVAKNMRLLAFFGARLLRRKQ